MQNKQQILYINGDSWCSSRLFREALLDNFPNSLVINSSIDGNWNSRINAQTINDIKILSMKNKKINCFVFYSECLRGNEELDILKSMRKKNKSKSFNDLLKDILKIYHKSLRENIGGECNLFVTTAFIDNCELSNFDTMLQIMAGKPLNVKKCFSIGQLTQNIKFFRENFNINDNIDYITSALERCRYLEKEKYIKNYHPNDYASYQKVIDRMKEAIK